MNFLVKTFLKSKLKHVPEEQLNMLIAVIEKNPEFFQTMAKEIETEVAAGKSQEDAAMVVLQRHGEELKSLMAK